MRRLRRLGSVQLESKLRKWALGQKGHNTQREIHMENVFESVADLLIGGGANVGRRR